MRRRRCSRVGFRRSVCCVPGLMEPLVLLWSYRVRVFWILCPPIASAIGSASPSARRRRVDVLQSQSFGRYGATSGPREANSGAHRVTVSGQLRLCRGLPLVCPDASSCSQSGPNGPVAGHRGSRGPRCSRTGAKSKYRFINCGAHSTACRVPSRASYDVHRSWERVH